MTAKEPEPPRVIAGFTVPPPGPRFKDELRWQADLALGRIVACLKAELGAAEAAEICEARFQASFKSQKKRGRPPTLSEGQKRRVLELSDGMPRRRIASEFAGEPGFAKTPAAVEKRVQRLRNERNAKKLKGKLLGRKPLKNKE